MRVGVFTGGIGPSGGGGNTLTTSIVDAIKAASGRHQFVIFEAQGDSDRHAGRNPQDFYFWRVRVWISSHRILGPIARWIGLVTRLRRNRESFEERCLRQVEVDAVWFLIPGAKPVPVPYVATVWDLEHRSQPYFPEVSVSGWTWENRERNYRTLLPRGARIVTGTNAGKSEIVSYYGVHPDNVRIVPLPVHESYREVSADKVVDVGAKYGIKNAFVFYPAQFWPHKNHINLLLAVQSLNMNADKPLHLVLTGSDKGNLRHVRETICRLGLTSQVHIFGFVPREDLIGFYCQSVALAYPSFFGPDNLPPIEAFAIGCPVAASRVAGADEQLGAAAVLFNPANPAEIAEAIRRIHENDEFRAELIRRGREQVALRTPQRYVEQICSIFDEFEPIRRCWGRHYVHT